ncbi:hypothetical protein PMAN_a1648 [Pseudoalteromonas marina]|nr:hypothetical protein PMAN_a1648 [Pseudoalteromonas marina]
MIGLKAYLMSHLDLYFAILSINTLGVIRNDEYKSIQSGT